ncbi:MAG: hypothetical protein WA151_19300 [Desulfatirhabdiaceae bacterium]
MHSPKNYLAMILLPVAFLMTLSFPAEVSGIQETSEFNLYGAQFKPEPAFAYRPFGLPVLPVPSDIYTAIAPFFGGVNDPRVWRMFRYDPSPPNPHYVEITASGMDAIAYGKAWWIISNEDKTLNITGTASAGDIQIPMVYGWNLISCPFSEITVYWSDVINDLANLDLNLGSYLFEYYDDGEYYSSDCMMPTYAYWAYVYGSGGLLTIKEFYGQYLAVPRSGYFSMTSNPPPQPPLSPGAKISLLSPNGGEILKNRRLSTVQWNSLGISPQGFTSTVSIEISLDGGTTYNTIRTNVPNTGFCRWRIPQNTQSTACVLKITSSMYPEISDVSDNIFTIQ